MHYAYLGKDYTIFPSFQNAHFFPHLNIAEIKMHLTVVVSQKTAGPEHMH